MASSKAASAAATWPWRSAKGRGCRPSVGAACRLDGGDSPFLSASGESTAIDQFVEFIKLARGGGVFFWNIRNFIAGSPVAASQQQYHAKYGAAAAATCERVGEGRILYVVTVSGLRGVAMWVGMLPAPMVGAHVAEGFSRFPAK